MIRTLSLCALLIAGGLLTNAQPISSKKTSPILLIMDGSGSMWGQIDGKTKIAIAREVIGQLVDKIPSDQPIGLEVYGHRRKGDCEDIETLLEPGTKNRADIKSALQSINPTGKTPLANTALKVIEKLKTDGTSATLILVSDGAESCGGDLCAVVRAAKEAGVDFVLHIVGFDIGESDKLALECAAQAGGGLYLDAANGDQLSEALEQATEITVDELEDRLSVKVTKDGALHDAVIKVYGPEDSQNFIPKRSYDRAETNPAFFPVLPGTYHVNVELIGKGKDIESQWQKNIVIPTDSTRSIEFDFTAGTVSIKTTANDKELWDCVVHISKSEDNKYITGGRTYKSESSNPMIKELTPGIYDVKITAQKLKGANIIHHFEKIEVLPGQTVSLVHNFEYGQLSIHSKVNDKYWDTVISIYQTEDSQYYGGGRTSKSADQNPFTQLFTPGRYSVKFRPHHIHGYGWDFKMDNIEVKMGEEAVARRNSRTGTLRFVPTHNGEPQSIDVYMEQEGQSVFSKRLSVAQNRDLNMMPGVYEIKVTPVKLKAKPQSFSLTVVAGKRVEKKIVFDSSE